ncbi:unnamed protein product, partial [marine sediment metagenome]
MKTERSKSIKAKMDKYGPISGIVAFFLGIGLL